MEHATAPVLQDHVLLAALQQGQALAFEQLMTRYNRLLFRAARGIVRDDAEAQDVVQEAWLRAFLGLRDFRGDAAIATWLTRITINRRSASSASWAKGAVERGLHGWGMAKALEPAMAANTPSPEENWRAGVAAATRERDRPAAPHLPQRSSCAPSRAWPWRTPPPAGGLAGGRAHALPAPARCCGHGCTRSRKARPVSCTTLPAAAVPTWSSPWSRSSGHRG